MLMGHPPPIITRGRKDRPQGFFEGLLPVQVLIVVQELVTCNSEVQEALADTLEAVQKMAPAGPHACHRVAAHTRAVWVTPSILAGAMVDRPMVISGLGKMVDIVFISEELRPDLPLGSDDGFDGRGAHMLQHFQRDLRRWRVLVGLGAALPQAQAGWTARRSGSSTATLHAALSGGAFAAFDFTSQPFTARTLVALIRFHLVLQLAGRVQMGRLVDATIQHMATTLCGPLLEVSGGGNCGGVQLQWPQTNHQQPCAGTQLALCEDRPGPVREHGTLLAQAYSAVLTGEALQAVVATFS